MVELLVEQFPVITMFGSYHHHYLPPLLIVYKYYTYRYTYNGNGKKSFKLPGS